MCGLWGIRSLSCWGEVFSPPCRGGDFCGVTVVLAGGGVGSKKGGCPFFYALSLGGIISCVTGVFQ